QTNCSCWSANWRHPKRACRSKSMRSPPPPPGQSTSAFRATSSTTLLRFCRNSACGCSRNRRGSTSRACCPPSARSPRHRTRWREARDPQDPGSQELEFMAVSEAAAPSLANGQLVENASVGPFDRHVEAAAAAVAQLVVGEVDLLAWSKRALRPPGARQVVGAHPLECPAVALRVLDVEESVRIGPHPPLHRDVLHFGSGAPFEHGSGMVCHGRQSGHSSRAQGSGHRQTAEYLARHDPLLSPPLSLGRSPCSHFASKVSA